MQDNDQASIFMIQSVLSCVTLFSRKVSYLRLHASFSLFRQLQNHFNMSHFGKFNAISELDAANRGNNKIGRSRTITSCKPWEFCFFTVIQWTICTTREETLHGVVLTTQEKHGSMKLFFAWNNKIRTTPSHLSHRPSLLTQR